MNFKVDYSDILVTNLLRVIELNTAISYMLSQIPISLPEFKKFSNEARTLQLLHYAKCVKQKVRLKEASVYVTGMNKIPMDTNGKILLNIRNVLDYIDASRANEQFSMALLMHCNKLFLNDIKDVWDIAKVAGFQDTIDSTFDLFPKVYPDRDYSVIKTVKELDQFLLTSPIPDIPKILLTTYALFQLPVFVAGNDGTNAAVLHFMLQKAGMHPYFDSFGCLVNIFASVKSSDDMTLHMFIDLYTAEMLNSLQHTKAKLSVFVQDLSINTGKYIDLSLRQVKGLSYIKEKGAINREMFGKLNNVSPMTSYRDLADLLQKGYVKAIGIGKATKYIPS